MAKKGGIELPRAKPFPKSEAVIKPSKDQWPVGNCEQGKKGKK